MLFAGLLRCLYKASKAKTQAADSELRKLKGKVCDLQNSPMSFVFLYTRPTVYLEGPKSSGIWTDLFESHVCLIFVFIVLYMYVHERTGLLGVKRQYTYLPRKKFISDVSARL